MALLSVGMFPLFLPHQGSCRGSLCPCATTHPRAPLFGYSHFYVTQGLRAGLFHCLTRCLLSLLLNLFSTFLPSFPWPYALIKVFYHAGCRLILSSSVNHQRVCSNSPLSWHIKSSICPLWAASASCPPLLLFQRQNLIEILWMSHVKIFH